MTTTHSKKFPLSPVLAALVLAGAVQCVHAATAPMAATVMFVSGPVMIQPYQNAAGASARPAVKGEQLLSGESIETGRGRVQLRMVDGATLALQPDTTLQLDDYHLAGDGKEEKGFLSLVKGGLRQVSGSIGHVRRDDYKLDTPMGVIGIRGTEFTVGVDAALTVAVVQGQVNVCNNGGCVDLFPGQISTTPSLSVRPAVRVAAVQSVPATQATAAQATTATSSAAVFTSGEQVRSALQAPSQDPASTTDDSSPNTSATPAPATLAPAPAPAPGSTVASPSPAPAPSVSPSPAPSTPGSPAPAPSASPPPAPSPSGSPAPSPSASPSPSPAPSPSITPPPTPSPSGSPSPAPSPSANTPPSTAPAPIATSGTWTLGAVYANKDGKTNTEATAGTMTFNASGAMTAFDGGKADLKNNLSVGSSAEASYDNAIAWGRWQSGQADPGPAGVIAAMHYFAFQGTPSLPVVGTYGAFASTAPTLALDAKAGTSVVGSSNGVTGTLNVNFTGSDKGTVTYGLTVPANGNVFTLAGTAMQKDTFGFTAKGIVTSAQTTNGCSPKCDGALPGGASVIGAIGGTAASRAGVNYGFNTTAGTITGVVVFKP